MNEFNDQILSAKYAELFVDQHVLKFDFFEFECGDGWLGLLDGTMFLIKKNSEENGVQIKLVQVKEKFGRLRIYFQGGDEYTRTVVDMAEFVSEEICELCGSPGDYHKAHGWLQARCIEHSLETTSPQKPDFAWQKHGSLYAEAVKAIFSMFKQHSMSWMQSPALAFGGGIPYKLLSSDEGCEAVIKFVKQLEHGVSI